jgi:hypothetical protein
MKPAKYLWHASYWAAICETDECLMPGRILEALSVIEQRLLSPIKPDGIECRDIENARRGLEVLRMERGDNFSQSNSASD